MQNNDWWYLIASIVSPFLAAGITSLLTLLWQDRKEKRDAKLRVFLTLMSARGNIDNFQTAQDWARALNLIDVVFANDQKVITVWHELYGMLQQQTPPPGQGHKQIELLTEMATALGFKKLTQTSIDKSHFPRAIADPIAKANEVQNELLRVLKNTGALIVHPLTNTADKDPPVAPTLYR